MYRIFYPINLPNSTPLSCHIPSLGLPWAVPSLSNVPLYINSNIPYAVFSSAHCAVRLSLVAGGRWSFSRTSAPSSFFKTLSFLICLPPSSSFLLYVSSFSIRLLASRSVEVQQVITIISVQWLHHNSNTYMSTTTAPAASLIAKSTTPSTITIWTSASFSPYLSAGSKSSSSSCDSDCWPLARRATLWFTQRVWHQRGQL